VVSSNTGSGYGSNFVAALSALKSTQNLYFGFPSGVFFGTRIAGANHAELLSLLISFFSIFSIWSLISLPLSVGGAILGLTNRRSIPYKYLVLHHNSTFEITSVLIMEYMRVF